MGQRELRSSWHRGRLVLHNAPSPAEIEHFLLTQYVPSPALCPWNAGGGFFGRDGSETLAAFESSTATRLEPIRQAIGEARAHAARLGIEKPPKGKVKHLYLRALGESWSAGHWLRACVQIGESVIHFSPLLGTGGNDGRLDFSVGFLRRLDRLFDVTRAGGGAKAGAQLKLQATLWAEPRVEASDHLPFGLLHPAAAGGAGTSNGASGSPLGSTWLYVFAIEGLAYLGRVGADLRPREGSPIPSPSPLEVARPSLCLPLWSEALTVREVAYQLVVHRSGRQPLKSKDSGQTSVARVLVAQRNGGSGLAVCALKNRQRATVQGLEEVYEWRHQIRRPQRLSLSSRRCLAHLDATLEALSENPTTVRRLLEVLGQAEEIVVRHPVAAHVAGLKPLPKLSKELLSAANDGTIDFKLALELCGAKAQPGYELRRHWLPSRTGGPEAVAQGSSMDFVPVLAARAGLERRARTPVRLSTSAGSHNGTKPRGVTGLRCDVPLFPSEMTTWIREGDPDAAARLMRAFLAASEPEAAQEHDVTPVGPPVLGGPAWLERLYGGLSSPRQREAIRRALRAGSLRQVLRAAGVQCVPESLCRDPRRLGAVAFLLLRLGDRPVLAKR